MGQTEVKHVQKGAAISLLLCIYAHLHSTALENPLLMLLAQS